MTDRELLQALFDDMKSMKSDMQSMKSDIQSLNQKVTKIEMTLENNTNHNIQLIAENHISLVDKLNEAIKVQDKSLLFEVQISGLRMKVEKLEEEIADIKHKIA